jgi:FkbM family methyltransferase
MIHFLRKVIIFILPKSILLKSKLKNGITLFGENRAGFGGRGVFIKRDDIEIEVKYLSKIVCEGDTVIDVGANIGVYSTSAAKIVKEKGVVVAVEPFPRIASMNLKNALYNNFDNVRVRVCCLSDKVGNSSFWMKNKKPNSFTLTETAGSACFNSMILSLDSLCELEKLERVDFIKIDAEGAENKVIKGGKNTIRRHKPIILVENTISDDIELPDGYVNIRFPGSHNSLMVYSESSRLNELIETGFKPTGI